jgi:hypothetical protein
MPSHGLQTERLPDRASSCTYVIIATLPMVVDKKRRRSGHAMLTACGHIGPDAIEILVRLERLAETRLVQLKLPIRATSQRAFTLSS